MPIKTLLIDNYDSYTYNLFQLLAEVNQDRPLVATNNAITFDEVETLVRSGAVHNIVISPGPGTPERPKDIGVCLDVLRRLPDVPVLGVCLGHQALAQVHGGRIVKAPEPVHGRLSALEHQNHPLFDGIPTGADSGFDVVRYHSLVVDHASLPKCLESIAWTVGSHHAVQLADRAANTEGTGTSMDRQSSNTDRGEDSHQHVERMPLIMALAHKTRPHYGVQFHPESVCTRFGAAVLQNFCRLTCQRYQVSVPRPLHNLAGPPGRVFTARPWPAEPLSPGNLHMHWRKLPGLLNASLSSQDIFEQLYQWREYTFWLDSSAADRGRYSFMGGRGGRLWKLLTYQQTLSVSQSEGLGGDGHKSSPQSNPVTVRLGTLVPAPSAGTSAGRVGLLTTMCSSGQCMEQACSSFFSVLEEHLQQLHLAVSADDARQLPFNFWGGLVGYLGYELKSECGGANVHTSTYPDAAFFLADQLVGMDHHTGDVYVLALHDNTTECQQQAEAWVEQTVQQLDTLTSCSGQQEKNPPPYSSTVTSSHSSSASQRPELQPCSNLPGGTSLIPPFRLKHNRQQYIQNIAACHQALHDGESYEICLTTALERPHPPSPAQLYKTLRRLNPAPYASWLSFGAHGPTICCSSPERFLRGDRGGVLEARPIKGTAPRHPQDPAQDQRAADNLANSEKERAENLMIVDLLRNDLGRVCEIGSVHVSGLMEIESYATVHQMVSTVRGLRLPAMSMVDCIRAAFPGGSMTGAPKVRTMEILDQLEGGARGVYSGCIGFLSFNDTFDLNIVIRTAVIDQGSIGIGAGGAIVVQSRSDDEYEEMRLKARALMHAVGLCDGSGKAAEVDDGEGEKQGTSCDV